MRLLEQEQEAFPLRAAYIDTPLGQMLAVADEQALYLLGFVDHQDLEGETFFLRKKTGLAVVLGRTPVILSIEKELYQYFQGELKVFKTPLKIFGTPFQKEVWAALQEIPFGKTCSYAAIAKKIGRPLAVRAVGQANGVNAFAIVIPCHRVINENGGLGGYASGIERKQWLLDHEQSLTRLCTFLARLPSPFAP